MAEESFLLLSLKEEKSKKLAQVISNETSRKILDYMGSKGAKTVTETEIAKALGLPISTVHYNMQHLVRAGLMKADEFHYSEKGKEVNHYSLSNKMIIIAPSNSEKFIEKLRKVLPVALVAVVAAGFIQVFSRFFGRQAFALGASSGTRLMTAPVASAVSEKAVADTATAAAQAGIVSGVPTAENLAAAAPSLAENAVENITAAAPETLVAPCIQSASSTPYALWFLFGAIFTLILYFIWDWIRERKK